MTTKLNETNMAVDTPIKERLYELMTGDEKLMPFKFATRVGLSPSTFHSLWTKGASSMHRSTAEKIAKATGTDPDWVHTGVVKVDFSPNDTVTYTQDLPPEFADHQQTIASLSKPILWEAITIVEDVLEDTNRTMSAEDKAEFIMKVCDYLARNAEMDFDQKQAFIDGLKIA